MTAWQHVKDLALPVVRGRGVIWIFLPKKQRAGQFFALLSILTRYVLISATP
jgi:hypothetical protein